MHQFTVFLLPFPYNSNLNLTYSIKYSSSGKIYVIPQNFKKFLCMIFKMHSNELLLQQGCVCFPVHIENLKQHWLYITHYSIMVITTLYSLEHRYFKCYQWWLLPYKQARTMANKDYWSKSVSIHCYRTSVNSFLAGT